MTIALLIMVIFLTIAIILWNKITKQERYDGSGRMFTCLLLFLVTVIVGLPTLLTVISVTLSFNQWKLEREAFVLTLNEARNRQNTDVNLIENATILSRICFYNEQLAAWKLRNGRIWHEGLFIPNAVNELEPIK